MLAQPPHHNRKHQLSSQKLEHCPFFMVANSLLGSYWPARRCSTPAIGWFLLHATPASCDLRVSEIWNAQNEKKVLITIIIFIYFLSLSYYYMARKILQISFTKWHNKNHAAMTKWLMGDVVLCTARYLRNRNTNDFHSVFPLKKTIIA